MSISFAFAEQNLFTKTNYNLSTELYNYNGNIIGGRMYVSTTSSGNTSTLINEFLIKEFYKKGKIGIVKDSKLYADMKNITEIQQIGAKLLMRFIFIQVWILNHQNGRNTWTKLKR